MKQSIKISVMALVAMFAFSTAADAQFGKLLKKAKSAVLGTSSQDAYWEQQKKNDEMLKNQQAKNEAELQEKLKQVGTRPYDANAELPKSPVARTIYTDPTSGQKMMLDMKSTSGDRTISGFWSVEALQKEGYLDWQMKEGALDKALVEKLFDKKFGGTKNKRVIDPSNVKLRSVLQFRPSERLALPVFAVDNGETARCGMSLTICIIPCLQREKITFRSFMNSARRKTD